MTLEQYQRDLMRSAYLAIALVPALGAVPDDAVLVDASPVDANREGAKETGYATARFDSE